MRIRLFLAAALVSLLAGCLSAGGDSLAGGTPDPADTSAASQRVFWDETDFTDSEYVLYGITGGSVETLQLKSTVMFDRGVGDAPLRSCMVAGMDRSPLGYTVTEPGTADGSVIGYGDRAEVFITTPEPGIGLYQDVRVHGALYSQALTVTSGSRPEGQYVYLGLENGHSWHGNGWALDVEVRGNDTGPGFHLEEIGRGKLTCSSSWEGFEMEGPGVGIQGTGIARGTFTWEAEEGLALSFKPPEPTTWKMEVRGEEGIVFETANSEKAAAYLRGGSVLCLVGSGEWHVAVEIQGYLTRQSGPNMALMDMGEASAHALPCLTEEQLAG